MLRHASAKSHRCELQSQLQGGGDIFGFHRGAELPGNPPARDEPDALLWAASRRGQMIGYVAVAVPLAPRCV